MEKQTVDMVLIGYYHFSSKDKKNIYYIVQAFTSTKDVARSQSKATVVNIFVDEQIYKKIMELDEGCILKVAITPNLQTGKLYYEVVI